MISSPDAYAKPSSFCPHSFSHQYILERENLCSPTAQRKCLHSFHQLHLLLHGSGKPADGASSHSRPFPNSHLFLVHHTPTISTGALLFFTDFWWPRKCFSSPGLRALSLAHIQAEVSVQRAAMIPAAMVAGVQTSPTAKGLSLLQMLLHRFTYSVELKLFKRSLHGKVLKEVK